MPDVEIVERHGRRRRARPGEVLADGERFALPMQFMDMDHAAFGFRAPADGSPDFTSPHRPGYRFADTNYAARLAADAAYEEMRRRMDTCRRDRQSPVRDARTLSLDALEQAAQDAYQARGARMRDAWRQR